MSQRWAPYIMVSKGQGHVASIAENGLCCAIAFPLDISSLKTLNKLHTQTPYESRILGSKGHRSQCIDY